MPVSTHLGLVLNDQIHTPLAFRDDTAANQLKVDRAWWCIGVGSFVGTLVTFPFGLVNQMRRGRGNFPLSMST